MKTQRVHYGMDHKNWAVPSYSFYIPPTLQEDLSKCLNFKHQVAEAYNSFESAFLSNKECDLKNKESEILLERADVLSQSLLRASCLCANEEFTKKIGKVSSSYRHVMEEFLPKMDKWSDMREKNIQNIQTSLQKFCFLKGTTTSITLVSSTLELLLEFGSLFHFDLNPKYVAILHAIGGLSMICSLSALVYSNHTVEDIIKDIRDEIYLLRELETAYRRGNYIDKDVQDLFPNGIDQMLVRKLVFHANGNLVEQWKHRLCSAIILTNIKKDKKLLCDEKFLASVKAFVESLAAQIWISRMKLRNLLDDMTKKMEDLPIKKRINGNEVFLNLAAINMYPLFFSLFTSSQKLQETKVLGNSLATIAAAFRFSESKDEGFEDMKRISEELKEYHRHVKKITRNLASDYD